VLYSAERKPGFLYCTYWEGFTLPAGGMPTTDSPLQGSSTMPAGGMPTMQYVASGRYANHEPCILFAAATRGTASGVY
jgi:hypothetical protein